MAHLSFLNSCSYGQTVLIPNENAVNPCFLELLIASVSGVLLIFGSLQLFSLIISPKFTNFHIKKLSKSAIYRLFLFFLQVVFLLSSDNWVFRLNATALTFVGFPIAFLELFKKPYSRGSLLWYFICYNFFGVFAAAQNILTDFKVTGDSIILYLTVANSFQILVSANSFYHPVHEVVKYYLKEGGIQANVIQNLTFTWMNPLIEKGYRYQKLSEKDIPTPPAFLDTKICYAKMQKAWDSQGKNKSLLLALIKTFGTTVLTAIFFEACNDVLSFAQPQILRYLIIFFSDESKPKIIGFLLAFGLLFTSVFETFLHTKFFITIYEAGLGAKGALMTMIYHKSLTLSPEAKKERSTGDIINIMSVDVNRIQDLANQFQMMVSAPIKLVLCLVSLYSLLGDATFAGVIGMIVFAPLNTILMKRIRTLHMAQMKFKDQRTSVTNELLTNIKTIKLYSIEKAILKKLDYTRNVLELGNFKKIGILGAILNYLWYCVPFVVSCSTFSVYTIIFKQSLTPDIVFPAMALFDLLSEPIFAFPAVVTSIIQAAVSFGRFTKFMLSEEIDEELLTHFEKIKEANKPAVEVKDSNFLWKSVKPQTDNYDEESAIAEPTVALTIDDFKAKKAELTCIVGRVGSGKSTFLQSVLGLLPCVGKDGKSPKINISGSIAYCSQVPWIMNATVKENILFGHRFDEEFYNKTIEVCQLKPDLEILPDGDETQVGEKGISLSGGQKARLSLARAVYARADVYLLDDVLSAVDAHVGKKIINEVFCSLLVTKTIILATNSISVLRHANHLVLLEGGKIVETGSLEDIKNGKSKLKSLIEEFGSSPAEKADARTETETETEIEVEESDSSGSKSFTRKNSVATVRRASIATFKRISPINKSKRSAQSEEKAKIGKADFKVYIQYMKACSVFGVVMMIVLYIFATCFTLASNYWLKDWSEKNSSSDSTKQTLQYVAIYAFFGLGSGLFTLAKQVIVLVYCGIRGGRILHDKMARAVVRSPMAFFETTPIGRIINRFSSDINSIDNNLPRTFSILFGAIIKTLLAFFFIGINMPSFAVVVFFLLFLYIYYQRYYIAISRDLKRIVSIAKSPIYSHLQETLNGCDIIRAFHQKDRFHFIHYGNVDLSLKSLYMSRSINRWLSVRLQFIGSIISFSAAVLTIINNMSPGMAGLLITYSLSSTSYLSFIVKIIVEVELNMVSAERVLEYCDLKPEAPEETDVKPTQGWPSEGSVKLDHYSTRYRENLDLVLNDISLDIKPQEKVGIVGRTGAGKSTLSLAIFRLIEPVEGRIFIDGINTSTLGLHDLRSNLAIIPQDSQAFEGTVRQNLDPVDQYSDDKLWNVLELSHLKSHIQSISSEENGIGLDVKLSEGGSNLSVGQRQLLCLARALLNPSKVLILDEATASVDVETDRIVQETIRKAFNDRTILTIAHRINTVMDSDKIVVLERGRVQEFDSPQNLLKNKNSLFRHLCIQGGYITDE